MYCLNCFDVLFGVGCGGVWLCLRYVGFCLLWLFYVVELFSFVCIFQISIFDGLLVVRLWVLVLVNCIVFLLVSLLLFFRVRWLQVMNRCRKGVQGRLIVVLGCSCVLCNEVLLLCRVSVVFCLGMFDVMVIRLVCNSLLFIFCCWQLVVMLVVLGIIYICMKCIGLVVELFIFECKILVLVDMCWVRLGQIILLLLVEFWCLSVFCSIQVMIFMLWCGWGLKFEVGFIWLLLFINRSLWWVLLGLQWLLNENECWDFSQDVVVIVWLVVCFILMVVVMMLCLLLQ